MSPYHRLIAWLARDQIAFARAEVEADAQQRMIDCYRAGKEHGYTEGESAGRAQVVDSLNRLVDARHDIFPQVTEEDIERVTKGVLH